MADRGEIKLREGSIGDLIEIYKATYAKLVKEIITATEAGKVQKIRTMVAIRRTLSVYGVDLSKWVRSEIPQYYLDGANVAVQDLKALGANLGDARGLGVIDREAIKALTDEVSLGFAESIRGVARNAERILDDALKQQLNFIIAEGKLTGATRKMIAGGIRERLETEGLSGLIDKSGRKWQLDTYANMLTRTKSVESRNLGLQNRMLREGYDLVQVSNHRTAHKACAKWEGKVLSLTGKTPGYPTVTEARASGLFHPNCQHAMNVLNPNLAALTHAYDNPYLRQPAATPPPKPLKLPLGPPHGRRPSEQ